MENQYIGGLPKNGACTVCRLKRELGEKELGGVFEAELTPQCTLWPLTWAVHMFIASRNLKKKKKIKGSIQKPDSPHIICLPWRNFIISKIGFG